MSRSILSTCLVLCLGLQALPAQAQRALTHTDYDQWERVSETLHSRQGHWIAVAVERQRGDSYLVYSNADGSRSQRVEHAEKPVFTATEHYLAYSVVPAYDTVRALKLADTPDDEMPHDSLVVVGLDGTGTMGVGHVKSFAIPERGGDWLAYMYEKGYPELPAADTTADSTAAATAAKPVGHTLVVRHLAAGREVTLDRVAWYQWAEEGKRLAVIREASTDSTADAGLWVFDTEAAAFAPIDTGKETYQSVAWYRTAAQLAYMATADSADAELRHFAVYHWTPDSGPVAVVNTQTAGLPGGWWVSEEGDLSFSDNGDRLFLAARPMPVKYAYEEDTTLLDDERPGVDIWHWQDNWLQPYQVMNAKQEQKRDYTGVYWLEAGTYVQLADETLPEINLGYKQRAPVALAAASLPYEKTYSWEWPWRVDIVAVDQRTGQRTLVYEGSTGSPNISFGGQYFFWFEAADTTWMSYELATGTLHRMAQDIPHALWDQQDDHPILKEAYGSGGWLQDDEAVLVYDYHDIWRVDPRGEEPSVCMTNGEGRNRNMQFRTYGLNWNDERAIPKRAIMPLSATHLGTWNSGIYTLDVRRHRLTERVFGEYIYDDVEKAPESDRITYTRQSFRESENVYAADAGLNTSAAITALNPQQDDYTWGSVELVEYTSLNGTPLKGLLYKPDNFDPSQQYPMIVYFYERMSQLRHRYHTPAPSRSTINFAWAVSNGYLVFVPDIVYTEGLPGPSAYDCIVPGTLEIMSRGYVDEDAIGLQGQSWGGYQTAYLITRTNLYSAAMAGAPVSNMTSAYGGIRWGSGLSRMFQYERTQSRIGGTLWERQEEYIENSPLFFADRIETPLMMMHNDEDSAVPWYQGIEMFVAMRRLNKPAWLVVYNGEPHNLRQWSNRLDLSMRMGQFFDHYLKGEPMPLWMREGLPAVDKGRYLGYGEDREGERLEE